MTRPARRRLVLLMLMTGVLCASAAIASLAFRSTISYFKTPSELALAPPPPRLHVRLGGLVEQGSLRHISADGLEIRFRVTDLKNDIPVSYRGLLPDLFREGQGVVAEGHMMPDGSFAADLLLAKHDEKYMPPEAARALSEAGHPIPAPAAQGGYQRAGSGMAGSPASAP